MDKKIKNILQISQSWNMPQQKGNCKSIDEEH